MAEQQQGQKDMSLKESAIVTDQSATLATEHLEHHSEQKAGLPHLEVATYSSQLFWLVISFGLLYLLMAKIFLPRVANALKERDDVISDNLEKAKQMQEAAASTAANYENELQTARKEAEEMINKASFEIKQIVEKANTDFEIKLKAEMAENELRLGKLSTSIKQEIIPIAAEIVDLLAQKLVRINFSADIIKTVVTRKQQHLG